MEKEEQRSLSRQKCMNHVFQNKYDTWVLSTESEVPCDSSYTQLCSAKIRYFKNMLELSVGMAVLPKSSQDFQVSQRTSGFLPPTSVSLQEHQTWGQQLQLFLPYPPGPIGCQARALLPRCSAIVLARVPPPLPGTDDRSSLTHSFRVIVP